MLRKAKIVCTIGRIEENELAKTIRRFINAGMDVARINMAHYDLKKPADRSYLSKLIRVIRDEARNLGKTVAIMGDIQGPKVRIKEFVGSLSGKKAVSLQRGDTFILTSQKKFLRDKAGASIRYEGELNFFQNVRSNIKKGDKDKPKRVEFWFGDGRVILQAEEVTPSFASCKVIVGGELKIGQGVSVKNSSIRPGTYSLDCYPKDRKDIALLLKLGVDLFALSFVNSRDDVRNFQEYIKSELRNLRLPSIEKRFCGLADFPTISKIETATGFRHLDEIMEASYGIMVARGDLALQTGIETIGIFQKHIIDRCVTEGKPVITATQMLLSMMDFKEPRRSEATDVTNAIFDGTDCLMLSEETADPKSKFPVESIQMMAQIASTAEKEIKRLNGVEYKYKIDQRHEKNLHNLEERQRELENKLKRQALTPKEYQKGKTDLERREIRDHISYNACEMTHEMKCSAILVLTETGRTARMVARFKPDVPILAGVYDEQIARILKLSCGVEAFKIKRDDTGYPFKEFHQVLEQAKNRGILKKKDRVVLVAGYPRREFGTVTFLNV